MQVLEVEIYILKPCTSYLLVTLVDAAIKRYCLTNFILSLIDAMVSPDVMMS